MYAALFRSFGIVALTGLVVGMGWWWHDQSSSDRRIAELEEQNAALERVIDRLGASRRVAEFVVTDQGRDADGNVLWTDLYFSEMSREGEPLDGRFFRVEGDQVWIATHVIRFDAEHVKAGDPLRGQTILLFKQLFGQNQAPRDGFVLDEPGEEPLFYRGANAERTALEQRLWGDFWDLANDEAMRERVGVDYAGGQAPFHQVRPNKKYRLTLDAHGASPAIESVDLDFTSAALIRELKRAREREADRVE